MGCDLFRISYHNNLKKKKGKTRRKRKASINRADIPSLSPPSLSTTSKLLVGVRIFAFSSLLVFSSRSCIRVRYTLYRSDCIEICTRCHFFTKPNFCLPPSSLLESAFSITLLHFSLERGNKKKKFIVRQITFLLARQCTHEDNTQHTFKSKHFSSC